MNRAEVGPGDQKVHLLQNLLVKSLDPAAGFAFVPVPAVAGAEPFQLLQGGEKGGFVEVLYRKHIGVVHRRVGRDRVVPFDRLGRRSREQSQGQQQAECFFQHRHTSQGVEAFTLPASEAGEGR